MGFVFLLLCEGAPVHLLLSRSHPGWAWALTAGTAYGLLWLLGDWQALRLRRTRVTDDALCLALGARWSARIPRAAILRAGKPTRADLAAKGAVRALVMKSEEPTVAVELREPVEFTGRYGLRRSATLLLVAPDEPRRMIEALGGGPGAAAAARRPQ